MSNNHTSVFPATSGVKIEEYATCRVPELAYAKQKCVELGLAGVEVFMNDVVPRTEQLSNFDTLAQQFREARRCSSALLILGVTDRVCREYRLLRTCRPVFEP